MRNWLRWQLFLTRRQFTALRRFIQNVVALILHNRLILNSYWIRVLNIRRLTLNILIPNMDIFGEHVFYLIHDLLFLFILRLICNLIHFLLDIFILSFGGFR